MAGKIETTAIASGGILSRERIVAKAGFNRWLAPPAALAIHLCIGMAYGFSVFWLPLSRSVGIATGTKVSACACAAATFWDKTLGTLTALTATNCEWTQFDLGWMFTLSSLCSARRPRSGRLARERRAAQARRLRGGLLVTSNASAVGCFWIGSGVIGGIWLGLGHIRRCRCSSNGSPTSAAWRPAWRSWDLATARYRLASRQSTHEPFQNSGFGRRVGNLRRFLRLAISFT